MTTTVARVGDRDRENTAELLSHALAKGYIDLAEYDTRVQAAFAAQNAEEIRRVLADLPVDHLRRSDPRRVAARKQAARVSLRLHAAGYLAMVTIVVAVWSAVALTTGETAYFWPVWPILGGAIGLLGHVLPVRTFCR
ncbi:DUF1707 domain-containing protein [Mycolicibacterium aichiense]|nr:DUF1707 domain-containing protein [Mycolicibacterium aichiense]STZ26174.1 protein of uncharacterised function (DUF1707) [Mycolicibacterium aichiense]